MRSFFRIPSCLHLGRHPPLLDSCLAELGTIAPIAVACEGVNLRATGKLCLVQLYFKGSQTTWLVDVVVLKEEAFNYVGESGISLRMILEDETRRKVIFPSGASFLRIKADYVPSFLEALLRLPRRRLRPLRPIQPHPPRRLRRPTRRPRPPPINARHHQARKPPRAQIRPRDLPSRHSRRRDQSLGGKEALPGDGFRRLWTSSAAD